MSIVLFYPTMVSMLELIALWGSCPSGLQVQMHCLPCLPSSTTTIVKSDALQHLCMQYRPSSYNILPNELIKFPKSYFSLLVLEQVVLCSINVPHPFSPSPISGGCIAHSCLFFLLSFFFFFFSPYRCGCFQYNIRKVEL